MKTKNVKVKTKDVKAGKVIFISHPIYGIEKLLVTCTPYIEKGIGLFSKGTVIGEYGGYERSFSLDDAGISKGDSRNGRRTFLKLKHAVQWADMWRNEPKFIVQHQRHCDIITEWESDTYHYYIDEDWHDME